MINLISSFRALVLLTLVFWGNQTASRAGTLEASFDLIPQDSVVNLSVEGNLDWVHWGLYTESSLNHKASVIPRLGNFELTWNKGNTNAWAFVYQFWDHYNGFSWTDGTPTAAVTDTTTGVWSYGIPNIGTGFKLQIPADPTLKTLKVYVGVYGGRGLFTAGLSDGSARAYQNTSLFHFGNGEGGVYTLQFAADSEDQTLDVSWTLQVMNDPQANVTLEAAALSLPSGNNPPVVSLSSPLHNTQVLLGDTIQLEATATDSDGTVARVEFFDGTNKFGESMVVPYLLEWQAAELGVHSLSAVATDDGDVQSTSAPVDVFVYSGQGHLAGTMTQPPPESVNLTEEGGLDWIHWGYNQSNSAHRKTGVVEQISDYTSLGSQVVEVYTNNFTLFSWSDGTPTASVAGTRDGVYVTGLDGGFEVTLAADTTMRRARVYAGLYGAAAEFRAFLSDASSPAYVDASLTNVFGDEYVVYSLDYQSASPGQALVIQYRPWRLFDLIHGNVTLQAVTVSLEGEDPLAPVMLYDPTASADTFTFSFEARAGRLYVVEYRDLLAEGSLWQTWTNINGTGETATLSHPRHGVLQRFYRVETRAPILP